MMERTSPLFFKESGPDDAADQVMHLVRVRSGGRRAHLIGLSLGGYTALHALARHPEHIDTVIVSGVTTQPFANQWLLRGALKAMNNKLRGPLSTHKRG